MQTKKLVELQRQIELMPECNKDCKSEDEFVRAKLCQMIERYSEMIQKGEVMIPSSGQGGVYELSIKNSLDPDAEPWITLKLDLKRSVNVSPVGGMKYKKWEDDDNQSIKN